MAVTIDAEPIELWRHPNPESTAMGRFKDRINKKYGLRLNTYDDLHRWSIENIGEFWGETWESTGVRASKIYDKVLEKDAPMFPRPDFFAGSLLNFAENLLYPANLEIDPSSTAIVEANEAGHTEISWQDLRERVRKCALAMESLGVKESDRVAGFLANHTNTLVAMLAATSMGAVWTGVSPDTGVHAVLERLVQIEPVLLFADNAVLYNGKVHGSHEKTKEILKGLTGLKAVVVFETVTGYETKIEELEVGSGKAWRYDDFVQSANSPSAPLKFSQLPPSHPVYILYSSGTTGAPKCIIHSAAGTLIQHKKEHILHCDIGPQDRLFYFTTCTWMMWHWLVSGLAAGATIILYDGSPFKPHGELSMPLLISELKITHFGTSAKYLSILEQKSVFPMRPLLNFFDKANGLSNGLAKSRPNVYTRETTTPIDLSGTATPIDFSGTTTPIDLSSLKAIYSTGSPLAPSTFQYVYEAFPPSINLGSITGGTDIISLFGAPCPLTPVYTGEIQVAGLGMAIAAYTPSGTLSAPGEAGDLVCTAPFPCQPIGFFGANGAKKYRASYFETFPGVWHHGDFVRFGAKTGGIWMLGRSDGILKPSGVRFGSAEIYNILLRWFPDEVADALCIGRRREDESDEVVVLFLKMVQGKTCDENLKDKIRATVRKELSARHVPGVIDECLEIPVTGNGKKVEIAVKQILCGINIKIGASVANAECLEWYREWARTH